MNFLSAILVGVLAMLGFSPRAYNQNVDRIVRRSTIVYSADDIRRNITLALSEDRPCVLELGDNIALSSGITIPGDLKSFSLDGGDRYSLIIDGTMPFIVRAMGAEVDVGGPDVDISNVVIRLLTGAVVETAFIVQQIPRALMGLDQISTSFNNVRIEADAGTLTNVFSLYGPFGVAPATLVYGTARVDKLTVNGAVHFFAFDGLDAQWSFSTFDNVSLRGRGTTRMTVGRGGSSVTLYSSKFSVVTGRFDVNTGRESDNVFWNVLDCTGGAGTFQTNALFAQAQTLLRVRGMVKTLSAGDKNLDL